MTGAGTPRAARLHVGNGRPRGGRRPVHARGTREPTRAIRAGLRELSAREDGSIEGLEGLPDAWRASCDDPRQRAAQDAVVDELYYNPAVKRWRGLGLRRALSLAAIYDAMIQHGEGTDPDGVPAMLATSTPPRRRHAAHGRLGAEVPRTFLRVRRATLSHASDPDTRAVWAESVGRVDVFAYLQRTGQWRLAAPVRVRRPTTA